MYRGKKEELGGVPVLVSASVVYPIPSLYILPQQERSVMISGEADGLDVEIRSLH